MNKSARDDTLLLLAQKQKALFDELFDFSVHEFKPRERQRRPLFGRRKPSTAELLYLESEELRAKADSLYGRGWWSVPWEEISQLLYAALHVTKRADGWRFETHTKSFDDGGIRYVVLADEGASQSFEGESIYRSKTISPYSVQERSDRMKRYDRATVNAYIYQQMVADSHNAAIRSSLTDNVYNDVLDYYVSEGWILQSAYRKNYEESMYTDKIVQGARAYATDRKSVKGLYAVGRYGFDQTGNLTGFQCQDFQPIRVFPEEYNDILSHRHEPGYSIYKLCEFIAFDNDVRAVPFPLFSDMSDPNGDKENLYYVMSAVLTLLGNKLTY